MRPSQTHPGHPAATRACGAGDPAMASRPAIHLLAGGLLVFFLACGGGGEVGPQRPPVRPKPQSGAPEPAPAAPGPAPVAEVFTFNPVAPHAQDLPFDARDHAQSLVSPQGHHDGAGVFVYTAHAGRTYVLLARRASWLSGAGTWGVFGGSVDASDQDSTGARSYSRAAEHELYEESVTVYHRTDANALRTGPTHLKRWRSGLRFRTFFSRQPYLPEALFNQGYRYAEQHNLPHKFRENDRFRWVLLDDLIACARAQRQTGTFTDVAGNSHVLDLYGGFFRALIEPDYVAVMDSLP